MIVIVVVVILVVMLVVVVVVAHSYLKTNKKTQNIVSQCTFKTHFTTTTLNSVLPALSKQTQTQHKTTENRSCRHQMA